MMRHHFKNSLLVGSKKVNTENSNISANTLADIFNNENIDTTDSYLREFDFDVHLDNFQDTEIVTPAIFIKGDKNTSVLNARILKSNLLVNLSGVTVTVNVKEARGKSTIPADVVDVNGLVQINLPSSTIDETGVNYFELVFQSGKFT